MRHALGEILLVVIGIPIAFQVDYGSFYYLQGVFVLFDGRGIAWVDCCSFKFTEIIDLDPNDRRFL